MNSAASHSEAIGKMIYYPFIILAVMVLARNRYFDNWDFPISLIIILLVYFIHALSCAVSLRRLAEQMRRKALKPLEKELVKATGLGKFFHIIQGLPTINIVMLVPF